MSKVRFYVPCLPLTVRNAAAEPRATMISAMPPSIGPPGFAKHPPPDSPSSSASTVDSDWGDASGAGVSADSGVDVGAAPKLSNVYGTKVGAGGLSAL